MISRNIKYLRQKKRKSQEDLAKLLGVSRATYANYEQEKSEPGASTIIQLADFFNVSINDLLKEDLGSPLFRRKKQRDDITQENIRILTITESIESRNNIEFVPVKAIAGYSEGFKNKNFITELPKFMIPKLPEGTYRAFEIEGDSMPPILEGYIVVGRFLEHARDLKNGKRYVLVLKNRGVVFKRVVSEINDNKLLILSSDNSEFLPYTVKITEVAEAWEFVSFIGFPNKIDINYFMLDKLHNIENQLNLINSRNLD